MAKFKKGDMVRALSDLGSNPVRITKGKIYECFGPSYMYPEDMIKIKDNLGSTNGWYEDKFELVEQSTTKHYKWNFTLQYSTPDGGITLMETKTQHYVSPEKINDYMQFIASRENGNVLNSIYEKIDNEFVEE